MSLRSGFELSSDGDDDWHSSERGNWRWASRPRLMWTGQLLVSAPAMLRASGLWDDGG